MFLVELNEITLAIENNTFSRLLVASVVVAHRRRTLF